MSKCLVLYPKGQGFYLVLFFSWLRRNQSALELRNLPVENLIKIDTTPQNISALTNHHISMNMYLVENVPSSSSKHEKHFTLNTEKPGWFVVTTRAGRSIPSEQFIQHV